MSSNSLFDSFKPYKDRFQSYHQLPEKGRDKEDIYKELVSRRK